MTAYHLKSRRCLMRLLLLSLFLVTGILGPALVASADPGPTWRGEYYDNVNLAGAPIAITEDAQVNFSWSYGSPTAGVAADMFSVRWTSFVYFGAGNYTFHATTDDGVRVWVDDQLVIDQWHDHPETTYNAVKYLGAGYHSLRVEYYENVGVATCRVWWDGGGAVPPAVTDWRGEYFNNTWLGGPAAVIRNDTYVNFDWGYGAPAVGIGADNFSVRWTRDTYFDAGNYTFSATVDDGVRVWVDGALVIDKWYAQSRTTHTGTIYLAAGNHNVRAEYFEQGGVAVCMINWTGGSVPPGPGPVPGPSYQEIIVDNRDAGFVWGGPASGWYNRATGFRGNLNWTWNSYARLTNWGKWFPSVTQAGNWEVYVYIANRYHGSKKAPYVIHHNGMQNTVVVNQNIYNNQWVSMGTYYFAGGSGEYVYLGDNTGEVYGTRFVGFDAMKFVYRDGVAPPPSPPGPPAPPSGCAITPVLGFGRVWNSYAHVRSKLDCPTQGEVGIWAAEQPFQGGTMLWRQDTTYIYVLYNNGTWQGYDDPWGAGEPEYDPAIVPPAGYYQPVRGFGEVWRDNASVRSALSWATTSERGFYGSVQPYNGGTMLWSNVRGVYVLYNDGRWERFD